MGFTAKPAFDANWSKMVVVATEDEDVTTPVENIRFDLPDTTVRFDIYSRNTESSGKFFQIGVGTTSRAQIYHITETTQSSGNITHLNGSMRTSGAESGYTTNLGFTSNNFDDMHTYKIAIGYDAGTTTSWAYTFEVIVFPKDSSQAYFQFRLLGGLISSHDE
jgi:hypothetical protein